MSQRQLRLFILVTTALILAALAVSEYTPRASGQQIVPGGRPARIRSYFVTVETGGQATLIPTVEGVNGTILTDFVFDGASGIYLRIEVDTGSGWEPKAKFKFENGVHPKYSFQSGIPVPAGSTVRVVTNDARSVTVSGYTY